MTDTTLASASDKQVWEDKFFAEYVRDSAFADHMGTSINSVIQLKEHLTKSKGDKINIPLITRLAGAGITGDSTLEGNEEALGNYNHQLTVDQLRNGVRVGGMESQRTEIDIMDAGRMMLKLWCMDKLRDSVIAALLSAKVDGKTAYASCSEGEKDAFLVANVDRMLFGAAKSNDSGPGDHSAALLNVDAAADTLVAGVVSLAKRMAKTASPAIRPIKVDGGGEWFILYANSLAFRDLKADLAGEHADGGVRGMKNPMFKDGDLMWDGVIIREVPEIAVISGVGNAGIDVAPNFLCGAQAVGLGWAQRPRFETETFDYGNAHGVAVAEIKGVEKLIYDDVQNGVVTVYTAGVADT